jgi:hypothetical protein
VSKPPTVRPLVDLDPHPASYKTPIPRLPRAPRLPSDVNDLMRPDIEDRDIHDTEPITAESGKHLVSEDAEKTPLESIYSLKSVSKKLDDVLDTARAAADAARDSANASIATRSEVSKLAEALTALTKRVTALEVSGRWAPLTLSTIALGAVLWLAFQMQQLQLQLQMIHH